MKKRSLNVILPNILWEAAVTRLKSNFFDLKKNISEKPKAYVGKKKNKTKQKATTTNKR